MEISAPTIIALAKIGGKTLSRGRPKNLIFLKVLVSIAAIRVASVPKIISIALKLNMFEIKQPITRPGIAAGVRIGKRVNASEILN